MKGGTPFPAVDASPATSARGKEEPSRPCPTFRVLAARGGGNGARIDGFCNFAIAGGGSVAAAGWTAGCRGALAVWKGGGLGDAPQADAADAEKKPNKLAR